MLLGTLRLIRLCWRLCPRSQPRVITIITTTKRTDSPLLYLDIIVLIIDRTFAKISTASQNMNIFLCVSVALISPSTLRLSWALNYHAPAERGPILWGWAAAVDRAWRSSQQSHPKTKVRCSFKWRRPVLYWAWTVVAGVRLINGLRVLPEKLSYSAAAWASMRLK